VPQFYQRNGNLLSVTKKWNNRRGELKEDLGETKLGCKSLFIDTINKKINQVNGNIRRRGTTWKEIKYTAMFGLQTLIIRPDEAN